MKRKFFIILSVVCFAKINAQTKFDFEIGSRLRVTPVYFKTLQGNDQRLIAMQQDPHISGLSIVTGLRYKPNDKVSFGVRSYLRYDELFAELTIDSTFLNKYIQRLMVDYQLYGLYRIINKENYFLHAGLGLTFCNKNTEYSYNYYQLALGANIIEKITAADDFRFTTLDLPIEFEKDRFRFGLTTSVTMKHKFFVIPSDFLTFNLSVIYAIPIKKKVKS